MVGLSSGSIDGSLSIIFGVADGDGVVDLHSSRAGADIGVAVACFPELVGVVIRVAVAVEPVDEMDPTSSSSRSLIVLDSNERSGGDCCEDAGDDSSSS